MGVVSTKCTVVTTLGERETERHQAKMQRGPQLSMENVFPKKKYMCY